jgi:hypothetical protein
MTAQKIIRKSAIALILPLGVAASMAAVPPNATAPQETQQTAAAISAEAQQHIDQLAKAYLATQQLLAGDKFEGVAKQLATVQKEAKSLAAIQSDKLKADAQAVVDAAAGNPKSLDEARTGFKKLSIAVTELLKAAPPTSTVAPALYDVYCPMAKADWLQSSKDVANPYLGKEMSTCGKVTATIDSKPESKSK